MTYPSKARSSSGRASGRVDTSNASLHHRPVRLLVGLALALALAACTQGVGEPDTSVSEAPFGPLAPQPAPAINWDDWGNACGAWIYGLRSCLSLDGTTLGWCKRPPGATDPDGDGVYPGECLPACNAQPPYLTRCPADAVPTETDGQGCHCKRL